MTDSVVSRWRRRFVGFARSHQIDGLFDEGGNPIAFKDGKPLWKGSMVVPNAEGDYLTVVVKCETSKDLPMFKVEQWLRRFSASMGRFSVDFNTGIEYESGRRMTCAWIEVEKELSKRASEAISRTILDEDSFWIIGEPTSGQYMMAENSLFDGHSFKITISPLEAYRFDSFEEAVDAMCECGEIYEWGLCTPYPSRVRPMLVELKTKVKSAK